MKNIKRSIIFLLLILYSSNFNISAKSETEINTVNSDKISQYGITWFFNKSYKTGQFANGDFWVVGPVKIVKITPESQVVGKRTMNGSMINPASGNKNQGYDSSCSGTAYKDNLNAALNVSSSNPLELKNGSSLISTISIAKEKSRPQLQNAAILTVLASPPPEGSFRPPYCGNDKTIKYNVSQLNYNLLKKLNPVTGTPSLKSVEKYFERPWIDHVTGWGAGFIHPLENMQNYGRDMSSEVGKGALMLHLNFTDDEKRTLLVRFVQLGIDFYGIIQSGGIKTWEPDGGHASGRKWPIMFAGLMLNDASMKNIGKKSGNYLYSGKYGPGNPPPDYIHFGEDGQTFYVTADDVIRTKSPKWKPDKRSGTPEPYTESDKGIAEWGIRHSTYPYFDNKVWSATYRQCCTASAWSGFILAARIMGVQSLWNYNALFDYQDRYMKETDSGGANTGWRSDNKFTENMWDTYRKLY